MVIEVDEHGEETWTFYTAPRASVITTYEGLRRDAATLRVHAAAADGASSDGLFGAVEAGHLVEWFQARDCFVRYRVTEVPEVESDARLREFGVRPETYVAGGCRSGSLPTDRTTAAFSTAPETAAAGPFTAVAVRGHYDVCALTKAREAVCWNADAPGATATLPGRYIAIDASEGTTCAITDDGEAACWGSDDSARDASPGPYTAISTTPGYTCALTEAGDVTCWGYSSERAHWERIQANADDPMLAALPMAARPAARSIRRDHGQPRGPPQRRPLALAVGLRPEGERGLRVLGVEHEVRPAREGTCVACRQRRSEHADRRRLLRGDRRIW